MKKKIPDRLKHLYFEGELDTIIEFLIKLKGEYQSLEEDDPLYIEADEDALGYYLVRQRLEYDKEYDKRLKYEKKEEKRLEKFAEQNKKFKERNDAREKKEYERLKKKYENN